MAEEKVIEDLSEAIGRVFVKKKSNFSPNDHQHWCRGLEFLLESNFLDPDCLFRKEILESICSPIILSIFDDDRICSTELYSLAFKIMTVVGHEKDEDVSNILIQALKGLDSMLKVHQEPLDMSTIQKLRLILQNYLTVIKDEANEQVKKYCEEITNSVISHLRVQFDSKQCRNSLLSSLSLIVKITCGTPALQNTLSTFIIHSVSNDALNMQITCLCYASEAFFQPAHAYDLISDEFWKMIAKGLESMDNLVQKQSSYLMKRAVDSILNGDIVPKLKQNLFQTSTETFKMQINLWEDFFIILESIDEKQVHIIKQIASKLNNLFKYSAETLTNEKPIHLHWLLIIFRGLFKHQNTAIAKWSVKYFLSNFKIVGLNITQSESLLVFCSGYLLEALNNTRAYQKEDKLPLEDHLLEFFDFWTKNLNENDLAIFWNCLLYNICNVSWGPVPLYYVAKCVSIACQSLDFCLDKTTFDKIEQFILCSMRCQEPLLKCASQHFLLELLLDHNSGAEMFKDELEAARFLCKFTGERKILNCQGQLWIKSKNWLNSHFDFQKSLIANLQLNIMDDGLTRNALALLVALDPSSERSKEFLTQLFCQIEDATFRAYCDNKLEGFLFLDKVYQLLSPSERRRGRDCLTYVMHPSKDGLDNFLNTKRIADLAIASFYNEENFDVLLKLAFAHDKYHWDLKDYLQQRAKRLTDSDCNAKEFCKNVSLFREACQHGAYKDLVITCLKDDVQFLQDFPLNQACFTKKLGGTKERQVFTYQWVIYNTVCEHISIDEKQFLVIHAKAQECISIGDASTMPHILQTVQTALSNAEELLESTCIDLIDFFSLAYSTCNESRKNDLFWPSISAFIDLVFCNELSRKVHQSIVSSQRNYLQELMTEAETVKGIGPVLAKRLSNATNEIGEIPDFVVPFLGMFVCFGTLYRKDQKLVMEVNEEIQKLGEKNDANLVEGSDHYSDCLVRTYAIKIIASQFQHLNNDQQVDILNVLNDHVNWVAGGKTRYFENSLIHLTKHRHLQCLLIISDDCQLDTAKTLLDFLLNTIQEDSLQTSLRHLAEWTIIRLILTFQDILLPIFHESFNLAKTNRLGAIPSYLTILHFIASKSDGSDKITSAMEHLSPWCMSQHFGTRICAQICLKKLHSRLKEPISKFDFLINCIDQCVKLGNYEKNLLKLEENFFLSKFDPDINFNLFDICYNFPRLCGLSPEEWQYSEHVWNILGGLDPKVSMKNEKSLLASIKGPDLVNKELDISETENKDVSVIQKKITPWKNMMNDIVNVEEMGLDDKKIAFPNLALVASLIDKLPNLGGLCRTCEILGVGSYVISSKRFCEDREFRNVSVTAQNWVPISEVPKTELKDYFTSMRGKGYTIVAVEQTSNSEILGKFKFPEKTVLFLGNEKEGIPVDLIREVDVCLEIPQSGLIRSFNVHVTGAIVLWEYVRQMSSS